MAIISTPSPSPVVVPPDRLHADLALRDLTDPARGTHAIQAALDLAVGALTTAWSCPPLVWRSPPIVPVEDNYDRLGYTRDAASRDARYTRYVSDTCMLRSHTSAVIPAALRHLAAEAKPIDDVLVVCPGLVYRRDVIDRLHTGTPHQVDLWRISSVDRGRLGDDDLRQMVGLVLAAVLPGREWRTNPTEHPYTEHGLEVEADVGGEWVEVLECGLAAPHVLERAGVDPARHSGLAMGLGLDRLVMLRKGLGDIRLLRSTDPRVVAQLTDLEPYRDVSNQPAMRRDISVAVAADLDEELLGDLVRDGVGEESESIEAIDILSETPAADLPAAARARLGIHPDQKNLLIRITLRHVDRTLTDTYANTLRDRIYAAVHQGDA